MDQLLWLKDWYWAQREIALVAASLGAAAIAQIVLVLWIARRLREVALMGERVSRLADGLALLTDTTEAGLATLIRQVESLGKRQATSRTATRTSVAKRVAAAAMSGQGLGSIAETEALSESEVRLHLALTDSANRSRQTA